MRGDVTVPVGPTLALVGGVGYEDVEISSRDAVRDGDGDPVIGADGRYVTDKSAPRVIAYDVRRADLGCRRDVAPEPPHLARGACRPPLRFDDLLRQLRLCAEQPQQLVNVSVYDSIAGFGGS